MISDPVLIHEWLPVTSLRALAAKNPLGVTLLGEDIVVWQSGENILAWQDLCVHRGTRLSLGEVRGNRLQCPYHGWTYNEAGRCVHIPAHPEQVPPDKARVKTYPVQVKYDFVWVCLGEPRQDVPSFPEWDDVTYRKTLCGPYPVHASAPRIVENFLDVAHFPFVHGGILGDAAHPEIEDYEAQISSEGVVARNVRIYQPDPYGTGVGDTVTYTYRSTRPLSAYFVKESSDRGFSILLMITPHDTVESTAWMWMAMNYAYDVPETELVAYQDKIFSQDAPILQSQRPEKLPLDLQAELHLKSDRTAIAYRKWLKQLGLSFGVD
ncbi:MAG TPA: aromatic ring-hydroxylating dioxygenase subunit alpha [Anaerolineae bacterium]|nr:aromatic ring-hydroxylating dioxygenase subunit alpha [Anaerolineae bacterium]